MAWRVALLGGSVFVAGCSEGTSVAVKSGKSKTVSVKTVSAVQTELKRTTTQPATVHPFYRAEIRANITGYVKELKADIGDYVKAGAELVVIKVPEMGKQREVIVACLSRLQAEERQSDAGISLAAANVISAEAKLEEAKFQLLRADASLVASNAEFHRIGDLVKRQSVATRLLDEARKKRDSDQANKDAVRSSIDSAKADVLVAQAKKAAAEAHLAASQAETVISQKQLEELDVLMEYATLTAPFAGIVTARSVELGNLVRGGSEAGKVSGQPLFVVSQIDTMRIRVPVPERDSPLAGVGDDVTITLQALPGEIFPGKVSRVAFGLDESSRTMLVEIDLPNPDRKLQPGMFGQATIALEEPSDNLAVPAAAVRFDKHGNSYVYVVNADSEIEVVDVQTGLDNGEQIEITSGLSGNERLVGPLLRRLKAGQKVKVAN